MSAKFFVVDHAITGHRTNHRTWRRARQVAEREAKRLALTTGGEITHEASESCGMLRVSIPATPWLANYIFYGAP
jgi:hypothetical protein